MGRSPARILYPITGPRHTVGCSRTGLGGSGSHQSLSGGGRVCLAVSVLDVYSLRLELELELE